MSKKRKKVAEHDSKVFEKGFEKDTFFYLSNVGGEGRIIFSSKEDFDRFEAYLYLLNGFDSPRVANLFAGAREHEIFSIARGEPLIAIGAYSFTPKEFQLLVRPRIDGGVAKFMQKLQTAYTMYFNHKYQRSGRLFHSAYRSRKIDSTVELQREFVRTHLNAAKLFDEKWEEKWEESHGLSHLRSALQYRYSSVGEYRTAQARITAPAFFPAHLRRIRSLHEHVRIWEKRP